MAELTMAELTAMLPANRTICHCVRAAYVSVTLANLLLPI